MTDAARIDDLPGILAEIADAADVEAALLVGREVGGRRAYFPRHPGPGHWLTRLVGPRRAQAICERLAPGDRGIELEVPLGPAGSRRQRWRKIREMLKAGASKPAVVAQTGVHHKTVQRHRAKLARSGESDQGELF